MSYSYRYPRPALTVDCVVFGVHEGRLLVLLIRRGQAPFRGDWAIPGGFVDVQESIDDAARRELREETGLTNVYLEQLFTFGAVNRDPRERVVSVAYYALVRRVEHQAVAASDATQAEWFSVDELPALAFDHDEILQTALARLRAKVRYQPIGFELLPNKFTLTQLQQLYETILGHEIDKRNFRKKLLATPLLKPLEEFASGRHRAARLYRFDRSQYQKLVKQGVHFEI